MNMVKKSSKITDVWNKTSKHDKILSILAAVIFVSGFLPWISVSGGSIYGVTASFNVSYNGLHSYGFLSFLGALAYLLWRYLPVFGVKMPKFSWTDEVTQKILAVVILAGPALWILSSGFYFQMYGVGMWVALAASAVFTYFSFSSKKLAK